MIKAQLIGSENLKARVQALEGGVRDKLRKEVTKQGLKILATVKSDKLNGGVLNRVTGTLTRSINIKDTTTDSKIISTVGSRGLPYARVHEYGYDGTRRITQVFGRPLPVAIYTMVHYPQRSFLRSTLREMTPQILKSFNEVASNAVGAALKK